MMGGGGDAGMSERQFRRCRDRFEEEGEAVLIDRRLGKVSPIRAEHDVLAGAPAVDLSLGPGEIPTSANAGAVVRNSRCHRSICPGTTSARRAISETDATGAKAPRQSLAFAPGSTACAAPDPTHFNSVR
jgi:hypothetical protein